MDHAEIQVESWGQRNYRFLKERHFCPKCKRKKPVDEYVYCLTCRRDRTARPRTDRDSARARWLARRAAGRCPECGGPPKSGGVRCQRCLDTMKLYRWNRTRQGKPSPGGAKACRQRRREAGLCPECGGQPEPGRVQCPKCLKRVRNYKEKLRGRKDAQPQD